MRTLARRSRAASSKRKKVTVRSLSKGGSMKANVRVLVMCVRSSVPDDFMACQHGVDDVIHGAGTDVRFQLLRCNVALLQRETVGDQRQTAGCQLIECGTDCLAASRHYAVLHQHDRHVVAALLQVNRQLVLSGRSCIRKWILTLNKQKVGHWGFSPGFATAGPPADQADLTAGSQARCPATA